MADYPTVLSYYKKVETPPPLTDHLKKIREEALKRKAIFLQNLASTPPGKLELSDLPTYFPPSHSHSPPHSQSPDPKINPLMQPHIALEIYSKNEILLKSNINLPIQFKTSIQSLSGQKNPQKDGWLIPFSSYEELKKTLQNLGNSTFEDIPKFVIQAMRENCNMLESNLWKNLSKSVKTLECIPSGTLSKLFDFQLKGVEFVLERHGRALIGDEMGVGKTIQAIAAASAYIEEWPLLVICPASIKLIWRDELIKWAGLERKDIYLLDSKKKENSSAKVWIASYTMASNLDSLLKQKVFDVIIADECHYLKNFQAKRTKNLVPILQRSKRVILLSGTPLISRPAELFTLLVSLRPNIFKSFKDFANRYCNPKRFMGRMDYSGNSHTKELHALLSSTVMIRRLKCDVLTQLPPKLRQKIEIPVCHEHCTEIRKIYSEIRESKSLFSEVTLTPTEVKSFISEAYVLTCKAKAKGVCEYIAYLIQNECKFLVFGHHLEMLNSIENQVKKSEIGYIRIDGSTSLEKRNRFVEEFQNNKSCMVGILSILAAGVGLTLTAASTVVMAEMAWSPGVMIQAEDRVHRIGQAKSVNIHYLFGPATLDEYIWPKIHDKLNIITDTLDNSRNSSTASLMHPECKVGVGDFDSLELFRDIEIFNN